MRENALILICYGTIPLLVHVVMVDDRSARVNPGIPQYILSKDHESSLLTNRYDNVARSDRSDRSCFDQEVLILDDSLFFNARSDLASKLHTPHQFPRSSIAKRCREYLAAPATAAILSRNDYEDKDLGWFRRSSFTNPSSQCFLSLNTSSIQIVLLRLRCIASYCSL